MMNMMNVNLTEVSLTCPDCRQPIDRCLLIGEQQDDFVLFCSACENEFTKPKTEESSMTTGGRRYSRKEAVESLDQLGVCDVIQYEVSVAAVNIINFAICTEIDRQSKTMHVVKLAVHNESVEVAESDVKEEVLIKKAIVYRFMPLDCFSKDETLSRAKESVENGNQDWLKTKIGESLSFETFANWLKTGEVDHLIRLVRGVVEKCPNGKCGKPLYQSIVAKPLPMASFCNVCSDRYRVKRIANCPKCNKEPLCQNDLVSWKCSEAFAIFCLECSDRYQSDIISKCPNEGCEELLSRRYIVTNDPIVLCCTECCERYQVENSPEQRSKLSKEYGKPLKAKKFSSTDQIETSNILKRKVRSHDFRRYYCWLPIYHHFVCTEINRKEIEVIQLVACKTKKAALRFRPKIKIEKEKLKLEDIEMADPHVQRYLPLDCLPRDETLRIAEAFASGESKWSPERYSVRYNNCQHFASFCKTGERTSEFVENFCCCSTCCSRNPATEATDPGDTEPPPTEITPISGDPGDNQLLIDSMKK